MTKAARTGLHLRLMRPGVPNRANSLGAPDAIQVRVHVSGAVYDRAIGRRGWPIVGHAPPGSPDIPVPDSFLQDPVPPFNCRIIDVAGNIRPVTVQECEGLERAAVWEAEHVAERIRDHYAGRPNVHLERMKLRFP